MQDNTIARTLRHQLRTHRIWLVVGSVLFILVLSTILFFAIRPKYAVLFADLQDRDLAGIANELQTKKIPFELGSDGKSILVPEDDVLHTRLQLMTQNLNLQGTVGFELFNNSDLGMTEFVQKVNYQRALQGELARTIQSMEEVRSARVQLAIPEQGIFRKTQAKNKASVYLQLKPGIVLARAQVTGIQRLVAASVPEVAPGDVAVLDQHGIVLGSGGDGDELLDDSWSDRKKRVEADLTKKADAVLDRMFGAGASLVSIDVVLNTQRRATTVEEALPSHAEPGQAPTGVVTRERQSSRTRPEASQTASAIAADDSNLGESNSEYEYSVGKKTEQIQAPAGTIQQISVAVVLKAAVADADLATLRAVLIAAVGANLQRGDSVVITTARELAAPAAAALREAAVAAPSLAPPKPAAPAPVTGAISPVAQGLIAAALAIALGSLVVKAGGLLRRRKRAPLAHNDREAMLEAVRAWMASARTERPRL